MQSPEEVKKQNIVYRKLPAVELHHAPTAQFQSARSLYQQSAWQQESDEEDRMLKKRKRDWTQSTYHVNQNGSFTDSEEEEEEEDIHSQLKRMALANTVPSSMFSKASSLQRVSFSRSESKSVSGKSEFKSVSEKLTQSKSVSEKGTPSKVISKKQTPPEKQTQVTSPQTNPSVLSLTTTPNPSKYTFTRYFHHRINSLLKELEDEVKSIQPYATVTSKQRIKCINAYQYLPAVIDRLKEKYKLALRGFVPDDLVEVIAFQQGRLQEHSIVMHLKTTKEHGAKQLDIRKLFGKKGKKETVQEEKDVLKRYKGEFTTIFSKVTTAGKNGVIPPFLPLAGKVVQEPSLYKIRIGI